MFKIFGIITVFAIATTNAATTNRLSDNSVDGDLIGRVYTDGISQFIMAKEEELVCPTNIRGNVCADDCKTLLACSRDSVTPIFGSKCSDLSSTAPYCIPGKSGCSIAGNSSNPKCSEAKTSSFPCTNVGYFPDPSNCTLYHVCNEDTQETYQCPPRYVFDATTLKCKLQRRLRDCSTINCVRSVNKYVVHPSRKGFYAYCGTSGTIMFQCEDLNNYEFNPTSVNCEFVCKAEGWYPVYNNFQQYYECYRGVGFRLAMRLQTCPKNMIFDATSGRCIKSESKTSEVPIETEVTPTSSLSSSSTDQPSSPDYSSTTSMVIDTSSEISTENTIVSSPTSSIESNITSSVSSTDSSTDKSTSSSDSISSADSSIVSSTHASLPSPTEPNAQSTISNGNSTSSNNQNTTTVIILSTIF